MSRAGVTHSSTRKIDFEKEKKTSARRIYRRDREESIRTMLSASKLIESEKENAGSQPAKVSCSSLTPAAPVPRKIRIRLEIKDTAASFFPFIDFILTVPEKEEFNCSFFKIIIIII